MPQLGNQEHLYLMGESSGQIMDTGSIGGFHSVVNIALTYIGDRISLNGTSSRLVFDANLINPLADCSGYMYWVNKEAGSTNYQVLNSNPNAGTINIAYNGTTEASRHALDINGAEGIQAKVSDPTQLNTEDEIVYAFSYLKATRLLSFAVGRSNGFRGSTTIQEGTGLPVNNQIQFGRGPGGGDYNAYEMLELGTEAVNYLVGDLEDTVNTLLASAPGGGILSPIINGTPGPIIPKMI